MKTKNRPGVKITETLETDASFDENIGKQLIKAGKKEAKLAEKNLFEQLLGFSNESPNQIETKTQPEKSKTKNSLTGIIFDLKTQLIGNDPLFGNAKSSENRRVEFGRKFNSEYSSSIIKSHEIHRGREQNEQKRQIEQIMIELKKLISSTKALQSEFGKIKIESAPVNPGKYYVNFFDWLLIMIRQARQKAEDSKTWLETLKGKTKKLNYWGMAKKHGTSFSQANERNVATSTG